MSQSDPTTAVPLDLVKSAGPEAVRQYEGAIIETETVLYRLGRLGGIDPKTAASEASKAVTSIMTLCEDGFCKKCDRPIAMCECAPQSA